MPDKDQTPGTTTGPIGATCEVPEGYLLGDRGDRGRTMQLARESADFNLARAIMGAVADGRQYKVEIAEREEQETEGAITGLPRLIIKRTGVVRLLDYTQAKVGDLVESLPFAVPDYAKQVTLPMPVGGAKHRFVFRRTPYGWRRVG